MHATCDFVQRSHPSEEIAKSKGAEMGAGEEPNFKIKIVFYSKKSVKTRTMRFQRAVGRPQRSSEREMAGD